VALGGGDVYVFFAAPCPTPGFVVGASAAAATVGAGTVARASAALGALVAVANDLDGTVTIVGGRTFSVGGTPTGLLFLR